MNNKVLVELIVPDIEQTYSIALPINKTIGNTIILLNKALRELNDNKNLFINDYNCLYNRHTNTRYNPQVLIKDTDIRNSTKLILM